MRCKDKGKLCNRCVHYRKGSGCRKSHWLDMVGLAKGKKPTKSAFLPKIRIR